MEDRRAPNEPLGCSNEKTHRNFFPKSHVRVKDRQVNTHAPPAFTRTAAPAILPPASVPVGASVLALGVPKSTVVICPVSFCPSLILLVLLVSDSPDASSK